MNDFGGVADFMAWYCYRPGHRFDAPLDAQLCAWAVRDDYHSYQCSRHSAHYIGDYGLCAQHYKMALQRLAKAGIEVNLTPAGEAAVAELQKEARDES